ECQLNLCSAIPIRRPRAALDSEHTMNYVLSSFWGEGHVQSRAARGRRARFAGAVRWNDRHLVAGAGKFVRRRLSRIRVVMAPAVLRKTPGMTSAERAALRKAGIAGVRPPRGVDLAACAPHSG